MTRRDLSYHPTSAKDLEALAEISESDKERARQRWKDLNPGGLGPLADVTEETGGEG